MIDESSERAPPERCTSVNTQKGKPKRGRPKKFVDLEMVELLAHIQCTHAEIASARNGSVDTLWRHPPFAEVYKRGAEGGRKSLRRMQLSGRTAVMS